MHDSDYKSLAQVYDRLMNHVDYTATARFYMDAAKKAGWQGDRILDLACGTGSIMLELLKLGYEVWGVDRSEEMLAVADQKIFNAGFTPRLTNQDMRKLKAPGVFNLAVCVFDGLNYLLREDDLDRTLAKVHQALSPTGVFVFDMHSEYKMSVVLGERTQFYTSDDLCYIWQNKYSTKSGLIDMKLDIFVKETNCTYRRFEEVHRERYYSPETLIKCLEKTGFSVAAVYGNQSFQPPEANSERLYFVAQKVTR